MLDINKLREFGADVESGLERCMNNEGFYLKLVEKSLGDNSFDKLVEAIDSNDLEGAFEAAHSLKGVTGNLALTPIFNPLCELVELLRGKKEMVDTGTLVETILSEHEKLCKLDG